MTKLYKHKEVLPINWLFNEKFILDTEYQSYIIRGAEQKWDTHLNKDITENFYEVIFHMFNINAIAMGYRPLDHDFKPMTNELFQKFKENLDIFGERLINNKKEAKPTESFQILTDARYVLTNTINKYLDKILLKLKGCTLKAKNEVVHLETTIYLLLNVNSTDIYDLWELSFFPKLGGVKHIESFKWKTDKDKTEFKLWIDSYNESLKNKNGINDKNTILLQMENAQDHKQLAYIIKDSILLNRVFNGQNIYNPDLFTKLKIEIDEKKSFPYSLIFDNNGNN